MGRIGYHASHEQFAPSDLLRYAVAAEAAGFDCIMSSDHLAPWSKQQGQSGFAWSWLGAAMARTRLPFGVITAPVGWRYHPVLVAQATATLAEMFEGRFMFLGVGSGEAINEAMVASEWPDKPERNARLRAGAGMIRALFAGETVNAETPIPARNARLYTRPHELPPLVAGALTPETARWAGDWAQGLVTVAQPREKLRALIDAFRDGGGAGKPIYLQVHISYARSDEEALRSAYDQWRSNVVAPKQAENLTSPSEFEAATRHVEPHDMVHHVRVSADLNQQLDWVAEDFDMGFEAVFLHNVGRNQLEFIEAFGAR